MRRLIFIAMATLLSLVLLIVPDKTVKEDHKVLQLGIKDSDIKQVNRHSSLNIKFFKKVNENKLQYYATDHRNGLFYTLEFIDGECTGIWGFCSEPFTRKIALDTIYGLLPSGVRITYHDDEDLVARDVVEACEHFDFGTNIRADLIYAPNSQNRINVIEVFRELQ